MNSIIEIGSFASQRVAKSSRSMIREMVNYALEREQFGKPIMQHQMIQAKIADMKTRLEAARLLTLRAAWNKDRAKAAGLRNTTEASCAKLFASEAAMFITHQAVQIHGGMGYAEEFPVSRLFVDARVLSIFEGADETLCLKVIARQLISASS